MAKNPDQLAGSFETENTGGVLSGLLAEEDVFDRHTLWRLGSWGVASVGAIVIALYANQSGIGWRREQIAAADLARQAQQIQLVAKESQNETRRLASAIDTLNSDRDRLYSRVTVLEQGLETVTGAMARQAASAPAAPASPTTADAQQAAQTPPPAPAVSPVATMPAAIPERPRADAAPQPVPAASVASAGPTAANPPAAPPATPMVATKSIMAPPDAAASKLIEPEKPAKVTVAPMPEVAASTPAADDFGTDAPDAAPAKIAVLRTEFGVDVGGANSVSGLRALWRGLLKSRANAALTTLRPIIVIREGSTGLGMQLRLVAGPLDDAAAAAKICAGLIEHERDCETAVFDGQSLAMKAEEPAASSSKPAPPAPKPVARRHSSKRVVIDDPPKKPDPPSTLSSLFGRK
ncbi:hypothetical protein SAMN05444159_7511 [Bradyrhizobium lablabi]|uniref:SPOR domain-containing protein n=1 Tax=Bradyrhizobium lablabi TaxID=722472 RepID=A0A1M7FJ46_9BRAD|nr:hypothetical protein [Bradyrhizobium lablabi]SHM03808.1 hypothetical protein SAMN05444159_7511 [Bradyrhizobium lablabi]